MDPISGKYDLRDIALGTPETRVARTLSLFKAFLVVSVSLGLFIAALPR